MQPTDFSKSLTDFLARYLPGERGASKHTTASYRDTFILLLAFLKERKDISAEKLTLRQISKEIVVEFLRWLEEERRCCAAARNVRLAALHSFFKYLQYQNPENLMEWQRILSIPVKRTEKPTISYLSVGGIRLLLELPDPSTRNGRRNLALLSLMYESGARVQEIIDLTPSMVRLDSPCTVKLIGKGNKARIVPLLEQQVKFLRIYMAEQKLLEPHANMYPLFSNSRREKLTRAGVNYILAKYANQARTKKPSLITEKISCHCVRHSKAMHLLQSGVNGVHPRRSGTFIRPGNRDLRPDRFTSETRGNRKSIFRCLTKRGSFMADQR
ncbi:Integrase [Acididesulfobacillus acetoxydans]|uniref:Integrase n=1 Tax=Acididesulfobacillus acetoxydans TaxID=1561005 RepID=A0A8S0XW26_9FIRM|nr:tyrosine-type recombinase/integrase [Acididesulfobacillus acetoxydans]CAA7600767.1 Integrase [Acididesulfobacillus acetoxydans]CEJ08971.1 Integrase protein [Acididesulfobacillus acetoxydans]